MGAAVVVAGLLPFTATSASADETASTATASETRSVAITTSHARWEAGSGTRVRNLVSASGRKDARLRPGVHRKARTMTVQSKVVRKSGVKATAITVGGKVRTSVRGQRVALGVAEYQGRRLVQVRYDAHTVRSTRGYVKLQASIKPKSASSSVRLVAYARGAKRGQTVRVAGVWVVTVAQQATGTSTPAPTTPAPTSAPTSPAPTSAPTTPAPTSAPTTPAPTTPAPTTPAPTTPAPTTPAPGGVTKPTGSCPDPSAAKDWKLSFNDDFNTLDTTKWKVRDNTYLGFDSAWIKKDNVSVKNGALDIAGKYMPESEWKTTNTAQKTRKYSTGYLDTIGKFSQQYGYYEARIKTPTQASMARGLWPAFWLRGDNTRGEIDIFEAYGGKSINKYDPAGYYYWTAWADTMREVSNDSVHGNGWIGKDETFSQWHTYGVAWSPGCLRFTMDGKTMGTMKSSDGGTKSFIGGSTFDGKFNIRLNMQIGNSYWGFPDRENTRDESHMMVDYVRVWQ